MKVKLFPLLALVLCMSAFCFPVSAYAAADTTPPSINAWLEGDILHAETSDRGTGVEAVYIDGHRIGYLVDGAVEVGLSDYMGDGEYIIVYALDFAGNKSSEIKLKNPHYSAPATTPTQPPTTPAPTPSQPTPTTPPAASTSQPAQSGSTSRPTSTPSSQPGTTPAPDDSTGDNQPESGASESAIPGDSEANPFTPDGTGSVQDNATEQDGKEFFTITTEEGNVFYLVIDRQRDNEGVYLLNTVTEDDLMALAEKSGNGNSGESAIPTPEPVQPTPDPTPEPEPEPETKPSGDGGMGTFIFIILAAVAVGGAGYYFKILKPKREAEAAIDDDEDEDDEEYGDDLMDEDDSDGYEEWGDDFSGNAGQPDDTEYEFETEDSDKEDGGE